jgi:glycosyltransferase involved in cell wall biosynthesis
MATIKFYVGSDNWEPFGPAKLAAGGLGGSEIAVIRLSRALADRGHQVFVYGYEDRSDPSVIWYPAAAFDKMASTDLLVLWRKLYPVPGFWRAAAERIAVWSHDLMQVQGPPLYLARITDIVTASQFHHDTVDRLTANEESATYALRNTRRHVIPLGLDWRGGPVCDKDPHSFIYSSSPVRGLDRVLQDWPGVRAAWPDATLHVAYGFGTPLKIAAGLYPAQVPALEALLKQVEDMASLGVVYHDRLSQKDLHQLMNRTQFWVYPPHPFEESFCITAREALAAGCIPIARTNGALKELYEDTQNRCNVWKDGEPRWWSWDNPADSLAHRAAIALGRSSLLPLSFPTWDEVAAQWEANLL